MYTRPRMHGGDLDFAHSPTLSSEPKYLSHDSGSEWIPEPGEPLNEKNKSPVSSQKGWGKAAQTGQPPPQQGRECSR